MGEEFAVGLGLLLVHEACFYQAAPDTHHTYIYTLAFGYVDNIVHVVPVAILSRAVNVCKVPAVRVGELSVGIYGRHTVDNLYLYYIESILGCAPQVISCLVTVEAFGQEPAGITEPEEGGTVSMDKKASVVTGFEPAVIPRLFSAIAIEREAECDAYCE